ncbi:SRPBCC domain-containing protein [Pseudonocardia sp. C8]|uniref:SRPBCC family protein n=1 Tax=Pseudonocardia sp. C8 TaxID=2762759 RepID=UPI001642FDE3|nr:SRPBCC domain-containing protein [Pseudonocardia sp. C8]MBC3194248.1 SRPBCC domain-containing protein [Pseudonocardia sp. C8]
MPEIRAFTDDEDGRYRAVVEVEVPGTPDRIWELIATGPGVEAWFVPAEVEPREGGRIVTHHGDFGDSEGVVTAWEPPHRIAYDEAGWQGPDTPVPTWNTEILVEAVSGDTCVVRLSSGFLAGGDAWHDVIDGTRRGWTGALRNLYLYQAHFAGLPVTTLWVTHQLPDDAGDVLAAAGLRSARPGDEITTAPPAPALSGVVEHRDDDSVVVRTVQPCPGIAEVATIRYGGAWAVVGWHLYGEHGPEVRDREREAWSAWLAGAVAATG